MPTVSVLMSTYNGHKYIRKQLDSLLLQEGVDVHIIVRDDGSKDETPQIVVRKKVSISFASLRISMGLLSIMHFATKMTFGIPTNLK